MHMKTWDAMIKKALNMYVHRNRYAYFYGAKGEVLTEATMDYLIRCYPSHFARYDKKQLEQIKAYSAGKIGYDCSGFITAVSDVAGSSSMQFSACHDITDNLASGPAGSFLYRPGHIGLDIGYGAFLHCPSEGRTIEMGIIREYVWEQTGQSNYINMEGSDSR